MGQWHHQRRAVGPNRLSDALSLLLYKLLFRFGESRCEIGQTGIASLNPRCGGKHGLPANQTICSGRTFMKSTVFILCSSVALWAFPFAPSLSAADMASPTD